MAGYSLSGFFSPLIGLAQTWHFVLLFRFFDRIGKGLRSSSRDALIADVTHTDQRGASYGFHRAMDHAGAVVGPLVAATLLLSPLLTLIRIFLLAAIPAAVTLVVLLLGVKAPAAHQAIIKSKAPHLVKNWRLLGRDFRWFLAALWVLTLRKSTDAFILIRLSKVGICAGWLYYGIILGINRCFSSLWGLFWTH